MINASEFTMGCHINHKIHKVLKILYYFVYPKMVIRKQKINIKVVQWHSSLKNNSNPQYMVHHKFKRKCATFEIMQNIMKIPNPVLHIRATPKTRSGNITSSTTRLPDYPYSRRVQTQQHKRGENFIQYLHGKIKHAKV